MIRQKSKFWNFIFSLMPGCGQMYLGFMKRGLSLMLSFAAPIALAGLLDFGFLAIVPIVVWFYSFFDALNLNSAAPEIFAELSDNYLVFDARIKHALARANVMKYIGYGLIFIGLAALWNFVADKFLWNLLYNNFFHIYEILWPIVYAIPRVLICIAAIIFGIRLIRGKKQETLEHDAE